ncbi:MAG: GGDEF domain-containing protein, partial [Proteobacteria bacterium]
LVDGDKIRFGSTTILKFTHQDDIDQNFQQRMYDAAIRDSLTKVYNKAHFLDRLEKEFAYAKRHDTALSLVMFDLDFFKKVNDNYGHLAGDHALIAVTEICNQLIRSEDLFARYGGEEFAIICRGVSVLAGGIMCERIRSTIATTEVMFEGQRLPITVSIGVAGLVESHAAGGLELVALADKALYEAKQKGRNRVQISRGPSPDRSTSG